MYDRANGICSQASGVPVAVCKPHVSRATSTASRYLLQAWRYQLQQVSEFPDLDADFSGVAHLVSKPSDWPLSSDWHPVSSRQLGDLTARPHTGGALFFPTAGWLRPKSLCQHWISEVSNIQFHPNNNISELQQRNKSWILKNQVGAEVGIADRVVIASGIQVARYRQSEWLCPEISRGQITRFRSSASLTRVITGHGTLIPANRSLWSGSSHERYPTHSNITADDQLGNAHRAALLGNITVDPADAINDWAGMRATFPDRLPVVGPVPNAAQYFRVRRESPHGDLGQCRFDPEFEATQYHSGLYILAGLGSRGASQAGFTGQLLANMIVGDNADPVTAQLLHPARFIVRALRSDRRRQALQLSKKMYHRTHATSNQERKAIRNNCQHP